MRLTALFLIILIRGSLARLLGVRSPVAVVVRSLFETPANPTACRPSLRRILQLTWRSFSYVLFNDRKYDGPSTVPAVIFGEPLAPIREQYVRGFGEEGELVFVQQSECPNGLSFLGRWCAALVILAFCCVSFPLPWISRSNFAFERILEIARALRAVSQTQRLRPERVYFFSAFDRNANLIAYLLMQGSTRRVIKVPSPNPLVYHYRSCVSTDYVLTSPLQLPEYEQFQENWFVEKVWLWRTPGHVSFPDCAYRRSEGDGRSIGMLSGGQWRRYERGDLFDDERMKNLRAEEALHHALREYLKKHPKVRLTVYPHPSEKGDEKAYARALEVYGERFGTDRVDVLKANERTHNRFNDSDVLCSLWSTSALEAIYCGHKLIFTRLEGKPSADEGALTGIHVFDKDALFQRLDESLRLTTQQYFEKHELLNYRHDYYDAGPRLVADSSKSTDETTMENRQLINAESTS